LEKSVTGCGLLNCNSTSGRGREYSPWHCSHNVSDSN